MPFDLFYVAPDSREPPHPEQIEEAVEKLPCVERTEQEASGWTYEYLNEETGVTCHFSWKPPRGPGPIPGYRLTGLEYSVGYARPTFFARETIPHAHTKAHTLQCKLAFQSGPRGAEALEPVEDELVKLWEAGNRRTLEHMARTGGTLPRSLPAEQLTAMWVYQNARAQLLTRYEARGIYVPRVLLICNKLDVRRVLRAAVWSEPSPAVIPDCDAFVINKHKKKVLGIFGGGEPELVVVKAGLIMPKLEPHLRKVDRPIPHRVLEESRVLGDIREAVRESLAPRFSAFETVYVDDVVDVEH